MKNARLGILMVAFLGSFAMAQVQEYLVKFTRTVDMNAFVAQNGGRLEEVSKGNLYKWITDKPITVGRVRSGGIKKIQINRPIQLFQNPSIVAQRKAIQQAIQQLPPGLNGLEDLFETPPQDNPEILDIPTQGNGGDPLLKDQWGMFKIGADQAWNRSSQGRDIIVAVTDSGVDYNHPDLLASMWRNPKETPNDGIDNDSNGFVDDIVGWDFVNNDNKPFDFKTNMMKTVFMGGNPGHGTHVAGVVAATKDNAIGIAGIAPQAKIMALRFISSEGKGDTAEAVKAIDYAVANGATVINASWGSEGAEKDDFALREAIQRARDKGVLFVAAAGNGRLNMQTFTAAGYDNDNDPKPSYPAAYNYENMLAVAATDDQDNLAPFSNFGNKSVHLAAPGVKILSTVCGGKYRDTVLDLSALKLPVKATWDGTSMAAPAVSGALAVVLSQFRGITWDKAKEMLLSKTVQVPSLANKTVTGGRLDLSQL